MELIKKDIKGNEGNITAYAFRFLGKSWMIALSETKWHSGEKYKRTPIWVSSIGESIPALFIGKLAIGYDNRKNITDKEIDSNLNKYMNDNEERKNNGSYHSKR